MAKINLTPKKIYEQEFKTSMRGYDKKEVDEFLDDVIKDYGVYIALVKELQALGLDLKVLDEHNQEIELRDDDDEDEVINFNALDRYKADQMAHHHAAEAEDEGEEPKAEINLDEQAIAEDFIDSAVEDELDSLD